MPTLGKYMAWLRHIGGETKSGICIDNKIGMVPVIKMVTPDGKSVLVVNTPETTVLSDSTVKYYDRRLNVCSPFPHDVEN